MVDFSLGEEGWILPMFSRVGGGRVQQLPLFRRRGLVLVLVPVLVLAGQGSNVCVPGNGGARVGARVRSEPSSWGASRWRKPLPVRLEMFGGGGRPGSYSI